MSWSALVAGALVLLVACSPEQGADGGDLGPLAVVEDQGTTAMDALGGAGAVDITDHCVTLQLANRKTLLLVWRSAEVRWDKENRQILFTPGWKKGARTLRIANGDMITVGGTSMESDDPETKPNLTWRSPPDQSCSGELFSVHSVSR